MSNDPAGDLALALDPVLLATRAGLTPDPWQADVLRSGAQRILLNCSRQSGKSTVTALLAAHTSIYRAPALVLLLSPSLRQSQELFRKVSGIYAALEQPIAPTSESALRLELENGSRIVSLPAKEGTVRGYSGVDLLVIDEAARVPGDLYLAVRPMLAVSGGRLVALSTPWGTRGWWHDAWASEETWARWQVPATDCPRVARGFLEEERRTLGEFWFAQEYLCEFREANTQAFRRDDVERAITNEVFTWDL
jgi:hypothetical protein